MVDDLILQVNSGHVLWVGHSDSQQDAHQQVDHLKEGVKRMFFLEKTVILQVLAYYLQHFLKAVCNAF